MVVFFLPNLFWHCFSILFGVSRDFLYIEYFLLLFVFFSRNLIFFLIFVVAFFDFLNIFSQIFAFIKLSDLFYLVRFSFFMSPVNFIFPLFFSFFFFFYFKFFLKYINYNDKLSPVLVVNIFLLFMVVQNLISEEDGNNRPWRVQEKSYIASLFLKTYQLRSDALFDSLNQSGDAFYDLKIQSASQEILDEKTNYSKYLLIVNESWGVTPSHIQQEVLDDILNNKNISSFRLSDLNENGFTINGEIRELCQKGLKHFNLKNQKTGFENCLPNMYKNLGYYTVAMHGATSYMYDRKYWYPKVGFDYFIFRDTLPNLKSRCYSFPGACDKDLFSYVLDVFDNNKKVFFYWLTLNTHINYDMRDLNKDLFFCKKYNINMDSSSCRNLKLQRQFFYYLSQLINQPEMKGAYILVVGDHSPPLYGDGRSIFTKNKVPVLRIILK